MTTAILEALDDGIHVMNPDFLVTTAGKNGWSAS